MTLEQENANAEKAELFDFLCVLVSSPDLLAWNDNLDLPDEPTSPEIAADNMRKLYNRATFDGVYPLK